MKPVNYISLLILVTIQVVSAYNIQMGGDINNYRCGDSHTVYPGEDRFYMISWDGRPVRHLCRLNFKSDNYKHKMCAVTVTRVISSCQSTIKFYREYSTDSEKELDCNTNEDIKICVQDERRITVEFDNADFTSSSNVTIKVYTLIDEDDDDDDDYNYYHLIQPIASAAGGVLVIIGIAIGWCVFLKISRKRERQRKERLATNPPRSWADQARDQQAQGYTYSTQQSAMYPVVPPPGGAANPPPPYEKSAY